MQTAARSPHAFQPNAWILSPRAVSVRAVTHSLGASGGGAATKRAIIAIDGPAACGKGTLSVKLAALFNLAHLVSCHDMHARLVGSAVHACTVTCMHIIPCTL